MSVNTSNNAAREEQELWGAVGFKEGLEVYGMLDEGIDRIERVLVGRMDGCRYEHILS